ncbi:hypothetical protein [Synechococcus sp. CCY 9618]|uniref:hypothetical protein n=1 Tax=Synechococcus sp. CCY 9618 TaxID=2815602 RepID=UPI001C2355C3|nr:hypothetical protein [Synechococcus sp. CCY 9618]
MKFATAVIYTDDVAATLAFYVQITGIEPTLHDREPGFALLGADQSVAIASHAAGATALTPPRLMPWGQTVAYVQAPEGTIIGLLTPVAA